MAKRTGDKKTGDSKASQGSTVAQSSSNNGDTKTSEDTTN